MALEERAPELLADIGELAVSAEVAVAVHDGDAVLDIVADGEAVEEGNGVVL